MTLGTTKRLTSSNLKGDVADEKNHGRSVVLCENDKKR